MEVILLEKIERLGVTGSVVKVKGGYGRNYLIPRGKALRATKSNKEFFEKQRAVIEKESQEKKAAAQANAQKLKKLHTIIIRQSGEDGRLYGSVTSKDIVDAIFEAKGVKLSNENVPLNFKFKELGVYDLDVVLHSEVRETIVLNIARNKEEAMIAFKEFSNPKPETGKGDVESEVVKKKAISKPKSDDRQAAEESL